jgi:hypothetical protein
MTRRGAFIPRDFIEVPEYFGQQDDVQWHLATGLNRAIILARSRQQHELAYAMRLLQERHSNSNHSVADAIGTKESTLGRKLRGLVPATENDLILWAWTTGERRRGFRPNDLTDEPIAVPLFPMNRRRDCWSGTFRRWEASRSVLAGRRADSAKCDSGVTPSVLQGSGLHVRDSLSRSRCEFREEMGHDWATGAGPQPVLMSARQQARAGGQSQLVSHSSAFECGHRVRRARGV